MPTVDIDGESAPPLTQAQQDANELAYARQLTCKHNFNPAAGGTTMTIETNAGQKIGTGNHFREMGDGTMVGDLRVPPTYEAEVGKGKVTYHRVDAGPEEVKGGFRVNFRNNMCEMTSPATGEEVKARINIVEGGVYKPVTPDMLK